MNTGIELDRLFADRISDVPRSFIREILKVALQPEMISFAGGLPNRNLFPQEELAAAAARVFANYGDDVLQYGASEGFLPLREYIARRYRDKHQIDVPLERIIITSGSQQGLDLLAKVLINEGDAVAIEEPGYLGAIQAFSIYKPEFRSVPVDESGMDAASLSAVMERDSPKLVYTVPNFQNPSGITYPANNREAVAAQLRGSQTLLIEDDPYGDLRFSGEPQPSFHNLAPDNTIMLGSFSKVIVPGFRLGWIVAPEQLTSKLIIAKQATDLHTTHFTQSIIYQYLCDNDLDRHIARVCEVYGRQRDAMVESVAAHFPDSVTYTRPKGGMFLWVELPQGQSALELFDHAVARHVVFVPGDPFYVGRTGMNTLRLNFSCVDETEIERGIRRLGEAMHSALKGTVLCVSAAASARPQG